MCSFGLWLTSAGVKIETVKVEVHLGQSSANDRNLARLAHQQSLSLRRLLLGVLQRLSKLSCKSKSQLKVFCKKEVSATNLIPLCFHRLELLPQLVVLSSDLRLLAFLRHRLDRCCFRCRRHMDPPRRRTGRSRGDEWSSCSSATPTPTATPASSPIPQRRHVDRFSTLGNVSSLLHLNLGHLLVLWLILHRRRWRLCGSLTMMKRVWMNVAVLSGGLTEFDLLWRRLSRGASSSWGNSSWGSSSWTTQLDF